MCSFFFEAIFFAKQLYICLKFYTSFLFLFEEGLFLDFLSWFSLLLQTSKCSAPLIIYLGADSLPMFKLMLFVVLNN